MTNGGWFDKGDRKLMDSLHHSCEGLQSSKVLTTSACNGSSKTLVRLLFAILGVTTLRSSLRVFSSLQRTNEMMDFPHHHQNYFNARGKVASATLKDLKRPQNDGLHFEKFSKRLTKLEEKKSFQGIMSSKLFLRVAQP